MRTPPPEYARSLELCTLTAERATLDGPNLDVAKARIAELQSSMVSARSKIAEASARESPINDAPRPMPRTRRSRSLSYEISDRSVRTPISWILSPANRKMIAPCRVLRTPASSVHEPW